MLNKAHKKIGIILFGATMSLSLGSCVSAPSQKPSISSDTTSTVDTIYYTVTFDLGYDGLTFTQQVEKYEKAKKPEDPTRNGYTFLDWVDENNDHWVFNAASITEDITLYAVWSDPILYSVAFVNNGGTILDTQTGYYGDLITYRGEEPVAENQDSNYLYEFDGWDKELVIKGDMTFTAQYKITKYAFTAYYYDYDGETLLATFRSIISEQGLPSCEDPERQDSDEVSYQFIGWKETERDGEHVIYIAEYASCTRGVLIEGDTVVGYNGSSQDVSIPAVWNGLAITTIGDQAFKNNQRPRVVRLPASITHIGDGAFSSMFTGTIVVDPNNPVFASTETGLFDKNMTHLIRAFINIQGDFVVPSKVTSIGDGAFEDCGYITSITLQENLTSIGKNAFKLCSLSSINLPKNVSSIGESIFSGCFNLTKVEVDALNKNFVFFGSGLYNAGMTRLLWVPKSLAGEFVVPSTVLSIDQWVFSSCEELTSVVLPEGLISISEYLFDGCSNLTSVILPKSLVSIGAYAFEYCSRLTSLTLPKSLVSIGAFAFEDCSRLASLTLPESLASIGDGAFIFCNAVIEVDPNNANFVSSGPALFNIEMTKLISFSQASEGEYVVPSCVQSVGAYAFLSCWQLTSIILPDGLISIGDNSFGWCFGLNSIVIPDSVISIGKMAFDNSGNDHTLTIYCEAESEPDGWDTSWYASQNCSVVWGYKA